jgi:hypothetical protein
MNAGPGGTPLKRVDFMIKWTKEKIAELSTDEIETLRENAAGRNGHGIVELCNEELAHRKPIRVKKDSVNKSEDRSGQYVSEFHFVCPNELDVTRNEDGTIWTGTWVVDETHAENALKYGAVVSLHSSRAEPSYLQGPIKAWRKSPRQPRYAGEQQTQIREGIDFLFQRSDIPLPWKGDATGEKGYAWMPFPE